MARREQPPQPDIDRVLDLDNRSHALARDIIGRPLVASMMSEGIRPGIYLRGHPYRTELDHPIETQAQVWGHGGGDKSDWTPLIVQIAIGVSAGKQLEIEYQHRLRIASTSAGTILPYLYAIFGNSEGNAHILCLEDIGVPLGKHLEYLSTTFPRSRLLGRVKRWRTWCTDSITRLMLT